MEQTYIKARKINDFSVFLFAIKMEENMIKNYNSLKRDEKFERKIKIACDFHNAKYEFTQGKVINLDKVNVSFIEPHRFLIRVNNKKILVLYFDEDNMFLYNRTMPIDIKKLNKILSAMKDEVQYV